MTPPDVTVRDRYTDAEIDRYYDSGFWQPAALYDDVCAQAELYPDKPMLFDSTHSYTYAELRDQGLRLAVGLRRMGVQPGDRVAVQIPNWAEFGLLVVALNRAGAIMVPIMPIYRADEVGFVLRHSGAKLAITCGPSKGFDYLSMYQGLRAAGPGVESLAVVRSEEGTGADETRFEDLVVAS
jgi:non-ribosomal peptide synthetase component E (peptide arylation enzyme)